MAQVEMIMPKMGESVAEATIIKWLKNEGDKVAAEESILEIATDKVDSEVPSPSAGIITKRLFKEGDVVQVGAVIAIISTEASANVSAPKTEAPVTSQPSSNGNGAPKQKEIVNTPVFETADIGKTSSTGKIYSPLVRNIAKQEGISVQELESIQGTGQGGRVTKHDILNYLPNRGKQQQPATAQPEAKPQQQAQVQQSPAPQPQQNGQHKPAVWMSGNEEIVEMDRMRKLIADHMVMSKHVSPHVTSFVEADVTNIVMWREKMKKLVEKRENEKLTFTPIFIDAVVRAIKDFPMINVSIDGNRIIVRKNINIGMAAALPSGNLIVPVIKNADQMNMLGLTKAVNDLAGRARAGKLTPDEIQGGTYTISNVGTFGNVMGTPIINQPQVAILAVGAIRKKPAVIETPQGDTIGIRHMMFLSHSYDHRVVDGALGGSFVRRVADYLENFDINTPI
jgi:2-oxoglutarate dehydrogenase E2 component (dihydrolipoamide succinyltransferase)